MFNDRKLLDDMQLIIDGRAFNLVDTGGIDITSTDDLNYIFDNENTREISLLNSEGISVNFSGEIEIYIFHLSKLGKTAFIKINFKRSHSVFIRDFIEIEKTQIRSINHWCELYNNREINL